MSLGKWEEKPPPRIKQQIFFYSIQLSHISPPWIAWRHSHRRGCDPDMINATKYLTLTLILLIKVENLPICLSSKGCFIDYRVVPDPDLDSLRNPNMLPRSTYRRLGVLTKTYSENPDNWKRMYEKSHYNFYHLKRVRVRGFYSGNTLFSVRR